MALATYSDLQTAVSSWMRRANDTGFVAAIPDFIALAEARLNTELGPIETESTLTGAIDSRSIDISALTIVEPLSLWVTPATGDDEVEVQQQAPEKMAYDAVSGLPEMWAYDVADAIKFNRPCDAAYSFRFRYRGKLALASQTTNWLMTNYPNLYLAATLMWGAAFREDVPKAATWQALLDSLLPTVRSVLARGRRGTLRVDPALVAVGSATYSDLVNGSL